MPDAANATSATGGVTPVQGGKQPLVAPPLQLSALFRHRRLEFTLGPVHE